MMNNTNQTIESKQVLWPQILSLGILNALVVFSWIAYNNYQPKILVKFGFEHLNLFLAITQALVMVIVPIFAGLMADYFFASNTKKFIVFTVGISITAMLFMGVAFTIQGSLFEGWKMLLPALLVLWLVSMNIFISPANSMIELFSNAQQLPKAMAVIILLTELVAALEPSIIVLIDLLGSTNTFLAGAVLIFLGGFYFKTTTKNIVFSRASDQVSVQSNYIKIIAAGIMLGSITGILMNLLPSILIQKNLLTTVNDTWGNYGVSIILAIAALCALPLSRFVEHFGLMKSLITGFGLAIIFLHCIYFGNGALCMTACVGLAISYSLLSVSAFPWALQNISSRNITLGTGIFIGSSELVDQLLNIYGI
jgi:hypothetical protein